MSSSLTVCFRIFTSPTGPKVAIHHIHGEGRPVQLLAVPNGTLPLLPKVLTDSRGVEVLAAISVLAPRECLKLSALHINLLHVLVDHGALFHLGILLLVPVARLDKKQICTPGGGRKD